MITKIQVLKIGLSELVDRDEKRSIKVVCDANRRPKALYWSYDPADIEGMRRIAKRNRGHWNTDDRQWDFPNEGAVRSAMKAVVERHPDWTIVGDPDNSATVMQGVKVARVQVGDDIEACLLPLPLPLASKLYCPDVRAFRLYRDAAKSEIGLLLGTPAQISEAVEKMTSQGATCDDSGHVPAWAADLGVRDTKVRIEVDGWQVRVCYDLTNLRHYKAAIATNYQWVDRVFRPADWDGVINTTRKHWHKSKDRIIAAGLEFDGDDPEADIITRVGFDANLIAGWDTPAPNGYLLHAYQKTGAEFCVKRGMRALIGDEMGVGKTVQAIAAAQASAAPRIIVICPASARYVWEREISGWGADGAVQHVTDKLGTLDLAARWHILTYDLLPTRDETWKFRDEAEMQGFIDTFPELAKEIKKKDLKGKSTTLKITLREPLEKTPPFDDQRLMTWEKVMKRLRGELTDQILAAGPLLVILDEAHRVKNNEAKRTQVIQKIVQDETQAQILMLTGTPLRNNEHEAAALLSLIDSRAASVLSEKNGYSIEDIKDYLDYFMIRRTKTEVLPELPEKTRQRIEIDQLDQVALSEYWEALAWAREMHDEALAKGETEAEARQAMQGGIEQARTALGLAKVLGGTVRELVAEVVENQGCCVIFCAHHRASDALQKQLLADGLKAEVIDGRTPQKVRAAHVQSFQDGKLDVVIGGINAAGEAITLTRADTILFVELDWVPAALLQAEDRIHRVGQRRNCQIIQLVARMQGENLDEMMVELLGAKMERIGKVLGEPGENIIASAGVGSIQAAFTERLLKGRSAEPDLYQAALEEADREAEAEAKEAAAAEAPTEDTEANEVAQTTAPATEPAPAPEPTPAPLPKRGRGRPRKYTDQPTPTASERVKRAEIARAAAGGKRLMLRLTPEANSALKEIMAFYGASQETSLINQALIAQAQMLRAMQPAAAKRPRSA